MIKKISAISLLLISSCASFDKTHILPGQSVPGLGFTFSVPTENAWTAVEYGTSNKLHLFQLNDQDSYSIVVTLNRGPRYGMYKNAETHLNAFKYSKGLALDPVGWFLLDHDEWLEPKYGSLCIGYRYRAEDWQGRITQEPAIEELIGLACEHQTMSNVLITIEFTRRYDASADIVDIKPYAEQLFSSFEYHSI